MHRNFGVDKNQKLNFSTIKRLLSYIVKDYKITIIFVLLFIIISSVTGVICQLFIRNLVDDYINPLLIMEEKNYTPLLNMLLLLAFIYLIGVISGYLYNRLMVNISQGVQKNIRNEMFGHMQELPLKYFDSRTHGEIMSYYTNDIDTLRQMLSQTIPQFVSSTLTIIAILFSMIYLNIYLTLILLVGVFIMIKVSGYVAGKSGSYFIGVQKSLAELNGYIEELIDGIKVVKVFNYEEEAKTSFDLLNEELRNNASKANSYANIMGPINNQLGNLIYVLMAMIGGFYSMYIGNVSLGTIIAFLTLTKSFMGPVNQMTNQVNAIIMAMSGATRVFSLIDEEKEENDGTVRLINIKEENGKLVEVNEVTNMWGWKDDNNIIPLKGDVRFNNVTFGYDKEKIVLHDISLYAKPGQKIAFVGRTGAGKTTITNLINRFYDIQEGTITYDGIDIKRINKKDLRNSIGMVLQDTNMFTGTIEDNIKYGVSNATHEDVVKAAKLANADQFITRLPDGYNTIITGNGEELSQGQRQLLAIARCAIVNPPVMILDEATSSIDTRTEKIVQDSMDKLMDGRTVFVIAHRLSTVRNAKAIMVLENGKIIERGNHEDLIKEKGMYYELYTGSTELE